MQEWIYFVKEGSWNVSFYAATCTNMQICVLIREFLLLSSIRGCSFIGRETYWRKLRLYYMYLDHCFMIASFKGFIELIYAAFNGLLSNIKGMRCSSVLSKLSFLFMWIILTERWYCSCQHWKCYTLSSENIYNTDPSVELSLFLQHFHDSAHKYIYRDEKIDQEELIPFHLRFLYSVAWRVAV